MSPLVKELLRSCRRLALIATVLAFMLFYVFKLGYNTQPVPYSLFVGIRIYIQGLANILIIVGLQKYFPLQTARKRKALLYLIGYLFAIVFFYCTAPLELYFSPHQGSDVLTLVEHVEAILLQAAINNSIVIFSYNVAILRHEKETTDLENSRLKAASLESANLLLKQQIHPHFLFNALSMLKSLYKSDLKAGEAYLSHLVNFLRASLADPQSKASRLSDEIRLCNDYLEMQKIRFEDALTCNIDIPEHILSQGFVPSFSIQSLIENAIKHNEATESSPLAIKVFYRDKRIITENNLQLRRYIEARSGKGLINLVERYKLFSGDEVIINQDSATFSVSIKVLSDEISDH
jgi:two-component system LytT family sensor kinase